MADDEWDEKVLPLNKPSTITTKKLLPFSKMAKIGMKAIFVIM
jgi:hypothetical protein